MFHNINRRASPSHACFFVSNSVYRNQPALLWQQMMSSVAIGQHIVSTAMFAVTSDNSRGVIESYVSFFVLAPFCLQVTVAYRAVSASNGLNDWQPSALNTASIDSFASSNRRGNSVSRQDTSGRQSSHLPIRQHKPARWLRALGIACLALTICSLAEAQAKKPKKPKKPKDKDLMEAMEQKQMGELSSIPVPLPDDLDSIVKDRDAAILLGKALFWDMQVGSDGKTACATCHWHAGADARTKNTLYPGAPGSAFGPQRDGQEELEALADERFEQNDRANIELAAEMFPFHRVKFPTQKRG